MPAPSSTTSEQNFNFNTLAKVIGYNFGPNSTDCCFQFTIDSITNGTQHIKSHRKLLASLSPVFAAMFNGNWDNNLNTIPIVDASFKAFGTFLDYFYKGQITLNTENIDEILYLVHKYDIQELVTSCSMYLMEHLSVDNVVLYYALATQYDLIDLKVNCMESITQNMDKILTSANFIEYSQNILMEILKIRPSTCMEHIVFDTCIKWSTNQCRKKGIDESSPENLRTELGNCFELIKFKQMQRNQFVERIELICSMLSKSETDDIFKYYVLPRTCNVFNAQTNQSLRQPQNDVIFRFEKNHQNAVSTSIQYVDFKLSESLILEGITFLQPRLAGSLYRYEPSDVTIEVYQMETPIMLFQTKSVDAKYACITLPSKILIKSHVAHTIQLKIPQASGREQLHSFCRKKYKSTELIPIISKSETCISALHFRHLNVDDINQ